MRPSSRLVFGDPVTAGGRTIVPVARFEATGVGGFGFGDQGADDDHAPGSGGGGGGVGTLTAQPAGYLEVSEDGTRFVAIDDPGAEDRRVRALAVLGLLAVWGVGGTRMLRRAR